MYSLGPDHHKISFIMHNLFVGPHEYVSDHEKRIHFSSYNFDVCINVMKEMDDYSHPDNIEYYYYPMDAIHVKMQTLNLTVYWRQRNFINA
jgi:hypothetical protein